MDNLIRRAIWHIKRHLEGLWNAQDEEDKEYSRSNIECLERVMNNEKPYPPMDREEVF